MITTDTLNPSLVWAIEAARRGMISVEEARMTVEAWPANLDDEKRQKSEALAALASVITLTEARPRPKTTAPH